MLPRIPVLVLSALQVATFASAYKQPFAYLKALEDFATAFTNPASVIEGTTPTPLSDDVVGRIDITTTFVGRELNNEYLFGLFLEGSKENSTQLIGTPSSFTVQSAVVEPPIVAVSFLNQLVYHTINLTVPLQIDMFISFDDKMKIVSYDAILRRWSDFMQYMFPLLMPKLREELSLTTTNDTEVITLKTAMDVCEMSTEYCTGVNQQYDSNDACMSFMTQLPFGEPWQGGMNNGWCRYVHKNMVKYRPEVHCAHIGPTGGDMCIDRNYVEVTETVPFNATLLAYNASYNALDVKGVPDSNIEELVKVQTEIVYMTTVAFFSVSCVLYMLLLYVMAKAIESVLRKTFPAEFHDMSFGNQRNTVTYVLDIIITTTGLVLQLISSPILANRYTFDDTAMLKITALLVSGLYIFELTYRESMRWPLMTHHFCTVGAIVMLLSVLSYTHHPALMGAGGIWLFQATTEQSVFVGLFMYRLQFSLERTRNVLWFAAIQSLICKLAFAAYLLAFWGQKLEQFHSDPNDIAFSVLLVTLTVLLMCTQGYGAWAVWGLGAKVNKMLRAQSLGHPESVSVSTESASTVDQSTTDELEKDNEKDQEKEKGEVHVEVHPAAA